MGTEFIDEEAVSRVDTEETRERKGGTISLKRGAYGPHMATLTITIGGRTNTAYLTTEQVIALTQSLSAMHDYSAEGHYPSPIAWPMGPYRAGQIDGWDHSHEGNCIIIDCARCGRPPE